MRAAVKLLRNTVRVFFLRFFFVSGFLTRLRLEFVRSSDKKYVYMSQLVRFLRHTCGWVETTGLMWKQQNNNNNKSRLLRCAMQRGSRETRLPEDLARFHIFFMRGTLDAAVLGK